MKGIILEGIPASGKSRVIAALRQQPTFLRQHSTIVLGEHYTERAIEHLAAQTPDRYEMHMNRVMACLEPLRVLTVDGKVFADHGARIRLRYVLERFHLTNVARHGGDEMMLRRVENTLNPYHPTVVLLTVPPEQIEARLRDAAERRQNGFAEYVQQYGESWAEAANFFRALQDRYLELYQHSRLAKLTIDVGSLTIDQAGEQLAEELWGEPTG